MPCRLSSHGMDQQNRATLMYGQPGLLEEIEAMISCRHIRPVVLALLGILMLGVIPTLEAQQIKLDSQQGKVGDTITFTVSIDRAVKAVDALGLVMAYNPAILRYTGTFSKGPLVQKFDFFDVHERQAGQIRVAGFTSKNAIASGTSGNMVSLTFNVLSAAQTTVRIVRAVDDLAGLTTVPGTFTGEAT